MAYSLNLNVSYTEKCVSNTLNFGIVICSILGIKKNFAKVGT